MWKSALIEWRLLHRAIGWPMLAAAFVFVLVLKIQEPRFFLGHGPPFFWPSIQALICSLLLSLPWACVVSRGVGAGSLVRRHARQPWRACISCWLGICLEGGVLSSAILAVSITVDSMNGGFDGLIPPLTILLVSTCVLLSAAALAPGLSMLGLGMPGITLCWFAMLAASLGIFGWGMPIPLDRLLIEPSIATGWPLAMPTLAATLAGLLLSWVCLTMRKS